MKLTLSYRFYLGVGRNKWGKFLRRENGSEPSMESEFTDNQRGGEIKFLLSKDAEAWGIWHLSL